MNERLLNLVKGFDHIHVITNKEPNAGFCAYMTFALSGVKYALENNGLPVVNFDDHGINHFYDPDYGKNMWEYYFEPILTVRYQDVQEMLASRAIRAEQVCVDFETLREQRCLHWGMCPFDDFGRIATFAYGNEKRADIETWMSRKRALGRQYVRRFIKVKSHILENVDSFYDAQLSGQYVIGVHIRGTDFSYAKATSPEEYCRHIDERLRVVPDALIFLATDQVQYVTLFNNQYGSHVVTYDCLRSDSDTPVFALDGMSPYLKGEEALIDCLLLSRCDCLYKCAAAGGEYAMYFNPQLECTDFGLESKFAPQADVTACEQLRIGKHG